ncbi:protein of unknown function [Maridesulfovibrio hydrothermalis AM13 = DSM 14728]|uniref:Uncharacterized protein n=1 Tax=Maridesulfovibrio hydrothermalis AM13 = DSM 14728 TaxID=1121451 RepID=L0R5Y5_9BACT|nr:protein of unknown function [Maridesulfovibrio hydrothermalis AM13 = DSM 14728]
MHVATDIFKDQPCSKKLGCTAHLKSYTFIVIHANFRLA